MEELMAEPIVDILFLCKTEVRTVAAYPIHSVLGLLALPQFNSPCPLRFSTCRSTASCRSLYFVVLSFRLPSESSTTHLFSSRLYAAWYDEMWLSVSRIQVKRRGYARRYFSKWHLALVHLRWQLLPDFLTVNNRCVIGWYVRNKIMKMLETTLYTTFYTV